MIPIKKKLFIPLVVVVIVLALGVCLYVFINHEEEEDIVEYYKKLIAKELAKALAYELPEDASMYRANNDTQIDFGTFDFVIIGAGSTGCVIANRLSEIGNWTVLLLEAGTFSDKVNEVPALYALAVFSDYNWGYRSVPQTTACLGTENESCLIPRGKGIGGTSLINGLMYSRGHPTDYDKWAELTGDPTWSYENVLQYFKKSEDFHQTDPEAPVDWEYHASGGYLNVEHHNPSIDLKYIFLEANKELGYNITDYNSPTQIGASVVQYNTKYGRRYDQGSAFILPVFNRNNLVVKSKSYVTRVNINNDTKEATGCTFTHERKIYMVTARKEVILSAGVISSPHILMLSGIGPREHLEDLGIPVIENLPVGNTLREHVAPYGIQFSSNMPTLNETLDETILAYLNGIGPLTSNTLSHVFGFYKTSMEQTPDYPDLEIVVDLVSSGSALGKKFLGWKNETYDCLSDPNLNVSFQMNLILLHARSVGNIKLKSSSPFDYPLIDYNLLSDPGNKDIDTLYEAVQFSMELINTTAFQKIGAKFTGKPLPACKDFEYLSKEYWYCMFRQTSLALYHSVGTCPVGKDPLDGAVLDSNLRVFGIDKLRIADTSVFPFTLSGHPHATATMIGEKISDVIKAEHAITL